MNKTSTKKLLSALLAVAMIVGMLTVPASAADPEWVKYAVSESDPASLTMTEATELATVGGVKCTLGGSSDAYTRKANNATGKSSGEAYTHCLVDGTNPVVENGVPTSGFYLKFETEKAGTLEVVYTLNASKAFYVLEDGTAMEGYDGFKSDTKLTGETLALTVKAGSTYYVYCTGSKINFYGFAFKEAASGSGSGSGSGGGSTSATTVKADSYDFVADLSKAGSDGFSWGAGVNPADSSGHGPKTTSDTDATLTLALSGKANIMVETCGYGAGSSAAVSSAPSVTADNTAALVFKKDDGGMTWTFGEIEPDANGEVVLTFSSNTWIHGVKVEYVTAPNPSDPTPTPAPTERPVPAKPTVDPKKIDAYDFAAEKLDTSKYNNMLSEDEINYWYAATIAVGSADIAFPSFTTTDGTLSYNNNGATNHRLRTDNKKLTRYDTRNITDANDVVYHGYVYSNSAKQPAVKMTLNKLKAGDIVTYAITSNGGDSTIVFTGPNGVEDTQVYSAAGAQVKLMTFYPQADGAYSIHSEDEKLCVARIYVEHPVAATVSGTVTGEGSAASGLTLEFTNQATGIVYEAPVSNGRYTATLGSYTDQATYKVMARNARGVVVNSGGELKLGKQVATATHNVGVETVGLKKVSGTVPGLDGAIVGRAGYSGVGDLKLSFVQPADKVHVPEVDYDTATGAWATYFEPGVEYTVVAEDVNDYDLKTATVKFSGLDDKTDATIQFAPKAAQVITIVPEGVTAADLADAAVTFTMLNEGGPEGDGVLSPYDEKFSYPYVYNFTGIDGIKLRAGTYDVKISTSAGKQKLTANLVVAAAAVSKTVKFDTTPEVYTEWGFRSNSTPALAAGAPQIEGTTGTYKNLKIDATTGKFASNGADWVAFNNGCVIYVPVEGAADGQKVNVTIMTYAPGQAKVGETATTAASGKDEVIEATAAKLPQDDGKVYITITATANGYLGHIKVEPVDETIYTQWDFSASDWTSTAAAAGVYNTLEFTNGTNNKNLYLLINPPSGGTATVTVPVAGDCAIKVTNFYAGNIEIGGQSLTTGANETKSITYDYVGGKGTVPITVKGQTYFTKIELTYAPGILPSVDDIELKVGADKEYKTINAALAAVGAMKRQAGQRAILVIDPGDYEEQVRVDYPNVTFRNAKFADATLSLTNKGVNIGANEVRITHYYGTGYDYYSMTDLCRWDEDTLEVNKANGYASHKNPGDGTTNDSYWNTTVLVKASGFQAEGIIFENSFNQYISKKAAQDVVVPNSKCKEDKTAPRSGLTAGSTKVQEKAYVERAAALALTNNADQAVFDKCAFIGRQDTLYGGTVSAAFYDCDVYGGTDYIFGPMTAVFAKCDLVFNTSEDKNDVGYITAPQQGEKVNGYLMYNCTVTSTKPGVNSASAKVSKPGYFGRPWAANNGEAVFYKTIIEATDPSYDGNTASYKDGAATISLIHPAGWNSSLSGESNKCAELDTTEWFAGIDNSAKRAKWSGGILTEAKSKKGAALDPTTWLGSWNPFDGKDMTVATHTPGTATEADKTELTKALAAAEEASKDITVTDKAASEVAKGVKFVSKAVNQALTDAVTSAQGVAGSKFATEKDVADAVEALNAAVATYKAAIQEGTKTSGSGGGGAVTLDELMAEAKELKAGVITSEGPASEVEKDAVFVPSAVMKALNVAILNAETAINEGDETAKAEAFDALSAAMKSFAAAKDVGTKATSGGSSTPSTPMTPTTSTTTTNPDGSKTKTETKPNGTVVETTTNADGTKEIVETAKDGTVTTTKTETDGSSVTTVENPDGSTAAIITDAQGVKTEAATTAEGETTASVTLPSRVEQAVVTVPVPEITDGTVAVIVKPDGTEEIIKVSVADEDGLKMLVKDNVKVKLIDNSKPFDDVPADHWAKGAVDFASSREIFKGTSDKTFAPADKVDRGMMATVLFRLEGAAAKGGAAFGDVAPGAWYTDAVNWANEAGVVTGKGDGTFAPTEEVTREQMATMLFRYAKVIGIDTEKKGDMSAFGDAATVSEWAGDAMAWAVGMGLINGTTDGTGVNLSPAATASRAEAAIIMQRMVKLMVK